LTQVTDPTGTYSFTFDNMGRLTGTTTNYSFLTGRSFTTSYGYDAASNRTSFTDPENGSTTYAYDTLNRLQTLTPPAAISNGSFGFGYDALSRRTSLTRPNAVNTAYTYDNLSHLLSVTHAKGGVTLDGASYGLDNAGNRTSKSDLYAGVTTNYGYDNIYELLNATQSGTTKESYTYDPVGNRLTQLGSATWSYNSSNQLTARPSYTYTYDLNGNTQTSVSSVGTTTYGWDFENRLTSVTLPGSGGTVSFKYDPFGRRIYKSSSTGTSIFAYDADNLVEETNTGGSAVARYSQGLNIDEPLAALRSGTTSYYHADGLGSITTLSNPSGAVAGSYTHDSFGNLVASSGSIVNNFRYTGREWDSESSLYYYRARYYDPIAGKFLSEDRLRFLGQDANFYRYVWANPANFRDPRGLWGVGASVGGSFLGGVPTNSGTGLSFSNSVGGVLFRDPSAPGGFTPVAFNSYGGAAGGTRPSSGMCGNNGSNRTGGLGAGLDANFVVTNAKNAQQLSGRFYNTVTMVGPFSVDVGFGDNGVFVLSVGSSMGLGGGFGSANYTSNTLTSPAPPGGNSCSCSGP
jgi:RHS repeat-associated protein